MTIYKIFKKTLLTDLINTLTQIEYDILMDYGHNSMTCDSAPVLRYTFILLPNVATFSPGIHGKLTFADKSPQIIVAGVQNI